MDVCPEMSSFGVQLGHANSYRLNHHAFDTFEVARYDDGAMCRMD